jgi:hypothetical protein
VTERVDANLNKTKVFHSDNSLRGAARMSAETRRNPLRDDQLVPGLVPETDRRTLPGRVRASGSETPGSLRLNGERPRLLTTGTLRGTSVSGGHAPTTASGTRNQRAAVEALTTESHHTGYTPVDQSLRIDSDSVERHVAEYGRAIRSIDGHDLRVGAENGLSRSAADGDGV